MKILVADDDGVTRKVLKLFLAQLNYEAIIVEDGPAAVEAMLAPDAPQIAVLDWLMPGMDGIDVCRKIRAVPRVVEPYLLMLTTKKEKADIAGALDAGVNDMVTKPFNIAEMSARLRVAVRNVQHQMKLAAAAGLAPGADFGTTTAPAEPAEESEPPPPPPLSPTAQLLADFTADRMDELVLGYFKQAGVGGLKVAGEPEAEFRAGGYTAWCGLVVTQPGIWLDVTLEISEASAAALHYQMEGEPATEGAALMTFLRRVHRELFDVIEAAQAKGRSVIAPFGPVVSGAGTLRLSNDYRRHAYHAPDIDLRVTLITHECPLQAKRPAQLKVFDFLAESYPRLKKEEVSLLNGGAVLNDRFIAKIVVFDATMEESQPVPVFEPSATALDFVGLNAPGGGRT